MPQTFEELQQRITQLEKENEALRQNNIVAAGPTVLVPDEMKPLLNVAQQTVSDYFTDLRMEPTKGTIEINNQRYILVRASALSKDFLDTVQRLYADRGEAEAIAIGKNFLFDVAHTLGMNDAKNFHQKMNLTEPIAKLSAGPVHFAYTGWAFVQILAESIPAPDENFYLIYHHPFSFEADSWIRSGKKSDTAVCIMNSGYSSGWCEESFGISLTAVEVSCRAKGDAQCTFIMSPPHKIEERLNHFHLQGDSNIGKQATYDIPTFFERKKVEEEMQRSKALAEASARSKEDFVANMSHELRTPLGAILGFTDLLKKESLNGTQKEYVEAISSSGKALLSIINDILDLSKLDAGKAAIENVPFNIPELLHSVQTMFAPKAKGKGLQFSVAVDAGLNYSVYGDPMRLTQVLVNLVGNAVKFTEKGSIDLRCAIEAEDEKSAVICFRLKDTGIGIAEEKLSSIFERFTQADAAITRRYGGTGLGLAISKGLIALLGGSLDVSSKEGEGAEFSFTLSYAKAPAEKVQKKEHASLPQFNGTKTVMVVEDNPMNQKLTTIILTNNGFNVLLAENGSDAVAMIKETPVDLILMDIQMPVMDGYQATCVIRDELHIQTPIIAMTAHALAGEKEKCIEQGINDYLPKPFSEQDLLQKLGHWLKDDPSTHKKTSFIDLQFLRQQTRNNEAAIAEMVNLFVQHNPTDIAALQTAIEEIDYSSIYKKAHALRNSIGFFGLQRHIGEAALAIEKAAHGERDIENIRRHFKNVKAVCKAAVAELKNTKTFQ